MTVVVTIPPLAVPSFVSGALDTALEAVDVYNTLNAEVVTAVDNFLAIVNDVEGLIGTVSADVKGLISAAESLPGLIISTAESIVTDIEDEALSTVASITNTIATAYGVTVVNTDSLIARLVSAVPSIAYAVRSLSSSAQATMATVMNRASQQASSGATATGNQNIIGDYTVNIGGVARQVSGRNYADVAQVANLINAFTASMAASTTGGVSSTDNTAIASIVAGCVTECAQLGVPNSFAAVTTGLASTAILTTAASLALKDTLAAGDLLSLTSMAQVLGPSTLVHMDHDLIASYSKGFSATSYAMLGTSASESATTLATLLASYTTIDPSWNETTRGAGSVVDITPLTSGSDTFTDIVSNGLMQSQDPNAAAYYLATLYGEADVLKTLEATYPNITYGTGSGAILPILPSSMIAA